MFRILVSQIKVYERTAVKLLLRVPKFLNRIRNSMKQSSKLFIYFLFAVVSVQWIGCGAAELSSAKLYRNQRNYVRANEMFEKALISEPTDDETWTLYVQNLYDLKNYERIAEVIDTARKYAVTHQPDINDVQRATWAALFNGALGAFQQNEDSPEQRAAALELLKSAQMLEPNQPENYNLMGQIYFTAGDTASAIEAYRKAIEILKPIHQQGVDAGLMLNMTPPTAIRTVGNPEATRYVKVNSTDSMLVYAYPTKQTYVYFAQDLRPPFDWKLAGWKFGVDELEGYQPRYVSIDPYLAVASYYYQNGQQYLRSNPKQAEEIMTQAIPYLLQVQRLDPSNTYAFDVIPDIYIKLNKTDRAKQEYEALLAKQPSKSLYTAYGVLLLKANDYAGATHQFEKAMQLDPSYTEGVYNLAVTYQNWAASLQENKKAGDKGISDKEILLKLTKAGEYFDQLVRQNPANYDAVARLYDIYFTTNQKDKMAETLDRLRSMKSGSAASDPMFWETLGKYTARTDPAESAEAFKKADQLRR